MNFRRLTAAATFVAALSILPAYAQQAARPAAGTATRPAAGTTTARPAAAGAPTGSAMAVPGDVKIALIDTGAFTDQKGGIAKLVTAAAGVDREFQPRRTELQTLQTNMQKLQDDLTKSAPVQDPKIQAQKQDQFDGMKRDFDRKQQDAQIAYQKRMNEVIAPLYEDIGKSLENFARQRGIGLVLDMNKLQGAIFPTSDQMDITLAFIAEYNSKNPSTASAAAPGR